jgi:5-methyltetrahydropteroyltriglutamate--homocysteine methyltransferase
MQTSRERILSSHAGSLARPAALREMLEAKNAGRPYDAGAFNRAVRDAVAEGVRRQVECGIDIVSDGELSKLSFTWYARERLAGVAPGGGSRPPPGRIYGRDAVDFPEFFAGRDNVAGREAVVVGPLSYAGQEAVQTDIANFKAALDGLSYVDAFLPAVAPGTIEHWLANDYYKTDDAYLDAIADAMHEEYKAIIDAGFILQIDDPDLADGWQVHKEMDVPAYRRFADRRIQALNYALRGLPEERIRFHMCWGSYHGPHKHDIPLRDIIDLVLKAKAQVYSIEASNPVHEHEWQVFREVRLPEGKALMPGVVGHCSDFVEHPRLIAGRLIKYANLLGKENVSAGTDCGIPPRVGHPSVGWAKLEALVEGAALATRELWG